MSDRSQRYDVAIIGAGTAGLAARTEVAKQTDNYVVIDNGILGTTCARVGCMPSKAFIQVADTCHDQSWFRQFNTPQTAPIQVNDKNVMRHVRKLRDGFVGGVEKGMAKWRSRLKQKKARFIDANTLDLGDETIAADKIIIAAGSKPVLPDKWRPYADYLVDTDNFFELTELPSRMAVFGAGMIGIELGQALSRLGVEVIVMSLDKAFGGLTDPDIQEYAFDTFSEEMQLCIGPAEIIKATDGGLEVGCKDQTWIVDKVLLSLGRAPVIKDLGLENLGVSLASNGLPPFDPTTFQVADLPVFIVGDANGQRAILHEAADEGRIAGFNAVADEITCFQKRTFLGIAFTSPNIAVVGSSYKELTDNDFDFVVGRANYEKQGRALIMNNNKGLLHVYGDRRNAELLGAELLVPDGEHLAHLLAWLIALEAPIEKILALPFYHPTLEEALRTALRDMVKQADPERPAMETLRCQETPV